MKILKLILASLMVLAISCQEDPSPAPPADNHQFDCVIEHVSFNGSSRIPEWRESDAIGVTTALDNNVRCEIKDVASGTFHDTEVQGEAPYLAVYPYNQNSTFTDSVLTATIPTVQQLAGASVAPDAIVAVAKSSDKNLAFRNCMAMFKLTIPRDDIKRVEIYTNSAEEKIAGQFTVDVTKAQIEPEVVAAKADSAVTLLPEGAAFAPGSYYVSCLPGEYNGINIMFVNTLDDTVVVEKAQTISTKSNEGNQLGSFFYYEISTAEELAQWARETQEKATPWDVVTIMSNINMTGIEYTEAEKFSGVFNARKNASENYRISGLTKPLFNQFYGKCEGVDLESNIVYDGTVGYEYGCGMFAHYIYKGEREDPGIANVNTYGTIECKVENTLDHQLNFGGIVGASNGVPISNCTNNASIVIDKLILSASYLAMGGLVGAAQSASTATISDSKNYGTITIRNTTPVGRTIACGGIVGYVTQAIEFSNLENHGAITMTPESKQVGNRIMGGIVAQASKGITIKNCVNDAPITLTPGSEDKDNTSAAGGIFGYAAGKGEDAFIENCTNTDKGTITMSGVSQYSCPGGIAGWTTSNMNVFGCTNNADITFNGSSAKDLRMGGIIGNCANDSKVVKSTIGSSEAGNSNTGKITNAGGSAANAYIGGILGCSGSKTTDVINCHSTGDVINNASAAMTSSLCIGGITGYSGSAVCQYEDCTCKSVLKIEDSCAHKAKYVGTVHGNANTTINAQHNGLGGSVLGTALTEDNFLTFYAGNKKAYNIDTDPNKQPSYFIK